VNNGWTANARIPAGYSASVKIFIEAKKGVVVIAEHQGAVVLLLTNLMGLNKGTVPCSPSFTSDTTYTFKISGPHTCVVEKNVIGCEDSDHVDRNEPRMELSFQNECP
jgi:hypothetical protein